ncbi:hypothetical protein HOJ01_02065 [bacterium]|jgi:hypothetical protein|nr:hypothetical protein [bacterium]MBT6293568.1 hypothetical protein [bacterium]
MTKKLIAVVALMSLALAGCGQATTETEENTADAVESIEIQEPAATTEVEETTEMEAEEVMEAEGEDTAESTEE